MGPDRYHFAVAIFGSPFPARLSAITDSQLSNFFEKNSPRSD
jgi:hypothetical protein